MDLLLNDEQLLIKDFAELGWLFLLARKMAVRAV